MREGGAAWRAGTPFDEHIKDDHNMWNYLFFISYLLEKDDTEYTTNEVCLGRPPRERGAARRV